MHTEFVLLLYFFNAVKDIHVRIVMGIAKSLSITQHSKSKNSYFVTALASGNTELWNQEPFSRPSQATVSIRKSLLF